VDTGTADDWTQKPSSTGKHKRFGLVGEHKRLRLVYTKDTTIMRHSSQKYQFLRAVWVCLTVFLGSGGLAQVLSVQGSELSKLGKLYQAGTTMPPENPALLREWQQQLKPVSRVNLFGGAYWLVAEVQNSTDQRRWVLDPNGTIIENIEVWWYGRDTTRQIMGYSADFEFLLHYGKRIALEPGFYTVVIRFQSPYYASQPSFRLLSEQRFMQISSVDTALILGALGALLILAFYNLFIYARTQDPSLLFYSLYLLAYAVGWGLTFNLSAHLFGLRDLRLHYVPFFLLPVLNSLFYLRFLRLEQHSPLLVRLTWFNVGLSLLLLPSCFVALPFAHSLATLVIGLFVFTAFASGVVVWRRGYKPARFFTFAFVALLLPAMIILPANIGLIPDLIDNSELVTLLGGLLDGLLLAFALAERIRVLQLEKEAALVQAESALRLAHTDALTGLRNRQAFDHRQIQNGEALILIDLDGLKRINDLQGHNIGDALLRRFSQKIAELVGVSSHRLGGDEFVLLLPTNMVQTTKKALAQIEHELRSEGFPEAGVSYGIADTEEAQTRAKLVELADARMYQHKFGRRSQTSSSRA
jgi:diguanylate cyclase (GGDEF)-like protein